MDRSFLIGHGAFLISRIKTPKIETPKIKTPKIKTLEKRITRICRTFRLPGCAIIDVMDVMSIAFVLHGVEPLLAEVGYNNPRYAHFTPHGRITAWWRCL